MNGSRILVMRSEVHIHIGDESLKGLKCLKNLKGLKGLKVQGWSCQ